MFTNTKNYLSCLFTTSILLFVIITVGSAMFMQYYWHELPCPLCLLQRLAFFGIGYGAMLQLNTKNPNIKYKSIGIILIFILILEIVGVRQSLLDICPRPGHEWIGSAVLGLHLPIWSFLLGLLLTLGIAIDFMFLQSNNKSTLDHYPKLYKFAKFLAVILILMLLENLISIYIQCDLGQCHTFSYKLLQ